jgi:hypothetical protein
VPFEHPAEKYAIGALISAVPFAPSREFSAIKRHAVG